MSSTEFHYSGAEFEALSQADNYYGWILRMFGDRVHGRVAEVGAGRGNFSQRLLGRDGVDELLLIEPDPQLHRELGERFAAEPRVTTRNGYFGDHDLGGPLDAIVLVNVLEHIEDDAAIARRALAALRPGGALLLFVPAGPKLFGSLDVAFDHFRRYERRGLTSLLEESGFDLADVRYVNAPGGADLVHGRSRLPPEHHPDRSDAPVRSPRHSGDLAAGVAHASAPRPESAGGGGASGAGVMSARPRLSVVIPVYNETETLSEILQRVQEVELDKEIVLVDDFSTDGTRERLQRLAEAIERGDAEFRFEDDDRPLAIGRVQVIFQDRNYGKGAALRRGFGAAAGEVIVIQDADLEYDPHDYRELLRPIHDGRPTWSTARASAAEAPTASSTSGTTWATACSPR